MKLPRFSLRTLFVLVTLISIPLGWAAYQLNWIRQRHKFFSSHQFRADTTIFTRPAPLPWGLRLFGEEPHGYLIVDSEYMSEAKLLFPEAGIIHDAAQFRSGRLAP